MFFPPAKKVSFQPIDEEIITHTYTARHVDLSSSEDEQTNSESEKDESLGQNIAPSSTEETPGVEASESDVSTPLHDRYQSPETNIRGRRRRQRSTSRLRLVKKKRRWEWTIGDTETRGIADKETLRPPSPPKSPGGEVGNAVGRCDDGDAEKLEAPDCELQEKTVAAESNHDAGADSIASPEAAALMTQKTSFETTASDSDELHPLPSSRQPDRTSIVKALVKLFEHGT